MHNILKVQAPAKVNLSLEVLGKRPDGYHELRTIMQAVDLRDTLRIRPRQDGRISLSCDLDGVPEGEGNLVVQAAKLLKDEYQVSRGVDIDLRKKIPAGAGLGGGSSDCAATLRALNVLWELDLDAEELERLAGRLGSDIPFFVRGGTAVCTGRGEKVEPLPTDANLYYAIVLPDFPVSTATVYACCRDSLTMTDRGYKNIKEGVRQGNPELIGTSLFNALQEAACRQHPRLAHIQARIDNLAPGTRSYGHLLCGSGSSIFVLHASQKNAERAARMLHETLGVRCETAASLPDWGLSGLLEREDSTRC